MKILSILIISLLFFCKEQYSQVVFTTQQVALDGNNIKSYIWNTGVFDQNLEVQNTPGFEWPKGTGKYAIFTAGLTLGAYLNNQLRLATASYKGEYSPGYCVNGVFHTDYRFKIYKVSRGDNYNNNTDWLNWGLMVPYGAPFIDHNNNGVFEPFIDTPGVKSAAQTIFLCMTDADPNTHSNSEGFSGGTAPLGAEVHLTAWCYDNPGYQDMQFLKWAVINKNTFAWDSTIYSIVTDPDLGFSDDDYIGCDSIRNLAYCYNATNNDVGNSYAYGINPPAVGIMFLNCQNSNLTLKSFNEFSGPSFPGGSCETDPSFPMQAYWFMKGYKKDGTPYVIPQTDPPKKTKFCYPGEPETLTGWTQFLGKIMNCNGLLTGLLVSPCPIGDKRMILGTGLHNLNVGDTQVVQICQLIARGNSNLNSVTRLKLLSDAAKQLCENNFVIGVNQISSQVPTSFNLYQNYPNPFNPTTKIKFDIPVVGQRHAFDVRLKIYDALGREVAILVNEQLKPGTYETDWDATNYPSGVYFYKLETDENSFTKKMVLLK